MFVGAVSALATARRLDGWRGGSSLTKRQDGGEEPPTGSQPPLGEEATTDTAEPTDADETEGDGSEDSDDSDGTTKCLFSSFFLRHGHLVASWHCVADYFFLQTHSKRLQQVNEEV